MNYNTLWMILKYTQTSTRTIVIGFAMIVVMNITMYSHKIKKWIYMILHIIKFHHWKGPNIWWLGTCTCKSNHRKIMGIDFYMLLLIQRNWLTICNRFFQRKPPNPMNHPLPLKLSANHLPQGITKRPMILPTPVGW